MAPGNFMSLLFIQSVFLDFYVTTVLVVFITELQDINNKEW